MSLTKHSFFEKSVSTALAATFVMSGATVIGTATIISPTLTVDAATTSSSSANDAAPFSWDNASVYFLLTDRFCNGDTSNDHSYGRGLDKNGNAIPTNTPYTSGFFMGGDFAGITQKINEGYFDDLGVNAIWLSAPYEQIHGYILGGDGDGNQTTFAHYSYHGYYVLDYTETDKNFGTKQEFQTLVDTAHEHGIRIVMDIVMNHAGYQSIEDMNEFGFGALNSGWEDYYYNCANGIKGGENSPYHSTYINYDSSTASDWAKWWGDDWIRTGLPGYSGPGSGEIEGCVASLPDFKTESQKQVSIPDFLKRKWQNEGTYDAKIVKYGSSNTVTGYLSTWLSEWVREYGVDGFRCDTAKHVRNSEWKVLKDKCVEALKEWKQKNPDKKLDDLDFWMTGECWGHKLGKSAFYTDGGFDSMINFEFAPAAGSSAIPAAGSVDEVYKRYASEINSDPSFNALSYLASHDTTLINGDRKYAGSFLLMLPGGIQIYYGDETNRPILSVPSDSTDGAGHKYRSFMNWNSIDNDILNHWQKVGQFRRNHIAVGAGQHTTISTYDAANGYTFARTYSNGDIEDKIVATIFASPNKDITIDVSSVWSDGIEITNFYDGTTCKVSGGKVTFNTGANGTILMQEPQGKKGKVVITHINKDTNETIKTETMQGLLGDSYTTSPLSTEGYTVSSTKGNTKGTYSETDASVTYYYTFDSANYAYITAKYVDASTGAELAASETTVGKIGSTYTVSPASIKNYEVDDDKSDSPSGTVKKGTNTVTFKYNYVEPTNLQVHYYTTNWSSVSLYAYDESGASVVQYTGAWPGAAMTAEGNNWYYAEVADAESALVIMNSGAAQDPGGNKPKGYEANGEVWIKDGTVYPTGKVNVKYVSTDGKVLGTDIVKGMADGKNTYTTSAKSFDNYTLETTPSNATGTFTEGTTTVTYTYKSNSTPIPDKLALTASLSATTVNVGGTVTAKASATGGTGSYQYAFYYKKSTDSNWVTAQAYSSKTSAVITPAKAAAYNVRINVKDSDGTVVTKTINFTSKAGLTLTASLSATSVNVGSSVTAKASATGGSGSYTYAFYYKKSTDSQWVTAKGFSTTSSVAIKPAKAATYNVCIKVKDSAGTVEKKYINFTSKAALTLTASLSATSVTLGNTVTAKAAGTGGTGSYQYAFYYKKSTDNQWVTAKGFSTTSSVAIKPAKAATYNVCIKVKDSAGTIVKKYINFTSKAALTLTASLSATSVTLGNTVTAKAAGTGGTGSYTYAFYYKKSTDSQWVTAKAFSTTSSVAIKPAKAATYNVCIKVKDSAGTIVKKYINFTSKAGVLANTSTLSAESIKLGSTVTVKAAATGGSGSYQYAVFYKKVSDKEWTKKTGYTTTTSIAIKPAQATVYDVVVWAKDSTNKVVKKYMSLAVNSSTTSLKNTSTVSATSVSAGTKITIKGSASGIKDMGMYKYEYMNTSDGKYVTIADYSTSTSKTFTPSKAGTYIVRVTVQDMLPSLAVKTITVTVK